MRWLVRIATIVIAALVVTGATLSLTPANSGTAPGRSGQPQGEFRPRPEGGQGGGGGSFAFGEVFGHLAVVSLVAAPFVAWSIVKNKRRSKIA